MDLANYADLAVRLVNAGDPGQHHGDGLSTVDSFRALVSDWPQLTGRVTAGDLEALRMLRDEFREIFTSASRGREAEAIGRLNALLTRHPIHQQLTRHDGQRWHVHLVESGSVADRYAAAAIAGVTGLITDFGTRRLGVCAATDCERVFVGSGSGRDRRYCSAQCTPEASVRALRARGRAGGQGPASTAAS